mmetsp:Transcript_17019/g.64889  ORF Transcript_17019/g.64889 Transcript_17019/m.64889 type:complete len:228 (-) Transcript_17019:1018-1701(-)
MHRAHPLEELGVLHVRGDVERLVRTNEVDDLGRHHLGGRLDGLVLEIASPHMNRGVAASSPEGLDCRRRAAEDAVAVSHQIARHTLHPVVVPLLAEEGEAVPLREHSTSVLHPAEMDHGDVHVGVVSLRCPPEEIHSSLFLIGHPLSASLVGGNRLVKQHRPESTPFPEVHAASLRNPLVELTEPGSLIPAVPDEVLEGLWRLVDAKETDVRLQEVVHCHGERMQPR